MTAYTFLFLEGLVLLNVVLLPIAAQDVIGCGGFVESTVPIKYEKVEVSRELLKRLTLETINTVHT